MRFIIVLICMIIERLLSLGPVIRCYRWFAGYLALFDKFIPKLKSLPAWLGISAILIPLLLGVWLLNFLFYDVALGFGGLLFGSAVLLYCLGPGLLHLEVSEYLSSNDEDTRLACAQNIVGQTSTLTEHTVSEAVTHAVLSQPNQRTYSVLFWFTLLGPVGAVLYRALALCAGVFAEDTDPRALLAQRLQAFLDWIPTRLTALVYSLLGDFISAFACLRTHCFSTTTNNIWLARETGLAALNLDDLPVEDYNDEHVEQAVQLTDRVLLAWLVFVGLGNIIVWLTMFVL